MRPKALEARELVDAYTNAEKEERSPQEPWIQHAVREIQAGRDPDHVQFGLLFKHYEPRCMGLLKSLGLEKELDDLVQEIMWRVYRGLGDFRAESSFDTWVTRIAKNTALNAFRDRSTQKAKVGETSLDSLLDSKYEDGRAFQEPLDHSPDPLEITLDAEREAELNALLQELPPRMRTSMLLYYFHGYKQSEIADLQGTSVNTVKKQLVDGRKRIRPLFSVFAEVFSLLMVVLLLVGSLERL